MLRDNKLQWQKYFKEILESVWTSFFKIRGKISLVLYLPMKHKLVSALYNCGTGFQMTFRQLDLEASQHCRKEN